ncbi:MAG: glycoside hydrolase domain-containing protein [Cellulosilyticaceae bacterium]
MNNKDKYSIKATIAEIGLQYNQDQYQTICQQEPVFTQKLWAWKGDQACSEIVLLTADKSVKVEVEKGDFSNGVHSIPASQTKVSFIKEAKGFVGHAGWYAHNPDGIMPTGPKEAFADIIFTEEPMQIEPERVQSLWVTFDIPRDAEAGDYVGEIKILVDGEPICFTYEIEVLEAVLPLPEDYLFGVEYWQHPYNVAEYYGVEPFSPAHLEILKSHMSLYKRLGGKAITVSIVEEAWGGQTYSKHAIHYPSMIKWIKQKDGNWRFDYDHFDKWVMLCQELGIGDQVICYSMMPWKNEILYTDEVTQTQQVYVASVDNREQYEAIWIPFLEAFVAHVVEKGWFDQIYMGYDERHQMEVAFQTVDQVKNAAGQTLKKVAAFNDFIGNAKIFDQLSSASIGLEEIRESLPAYMEVAKKRKEEGKKTTLYTATEHFPNSFIKSAPVESYWTIMYAGSIGADGYLRWAFDAWVEDPLEDGTHSAFQAGDCFLVYPDEKTSENKVSKYAVRLAKLDEGVRDINKLYYMKKMCPELEAPIAELLATVKSTYDYEQVETPQSWAVAGRPAKWATQETKQEMLCDMKRLKEGIKTLSKQYQAKLSVLGRTEL